MDNNARNLRGSRWTRRTAARVQLTTGITDYRAFNRRLNIPLFFSLSLLFFLSVSMHLIGSYRHIWIHVYTCIRFRWWTKMTERYLADKYLFFFVTWDQMQLRWLCDEAKRNYRVNSAMVISLSRTYLRIDISSWYLYAYAQTANFD